MADKCYSMKKQKEPFGIHPSNCWTHYSLIKCNHKTFYRR